jgi:hypothetical protein
MIREIPMTPEIDTALSEAKQALEKVRLGLAEAIGQYPTPIYGCGAQFNYHLEQRSQAGLAIDTLGTNIFLPTPRSAAAMVGVESR